MSTQPDDGGPAFPVADTVHSSGQVQYGFNGMSLRDYFAGQALAGLEAYAGSIIFREGQTSTQLIAQASYEMADAMLAARKTERK